MVVYLEAKPTVNDSTNSLSILGDAVRSCEIRSERTNGGSIESCASYLDEIAVDSAVLRSIVSN